MNVRIAQSPIHGRGVFANELIEEDHWQYAYGRLAVVPPGDIYEHYMVEWDEEKSFLVYAPFCYLNHSHTPNCELFSSPDDADPMLYVSALRDIDSDEELTIEYDYYVEWIKWRSVRGYKGLYEVSDTGLVRSLTKRNSRGHLIPGKVLSGTVFKNGYCAVTLRTNGESKKHYVHSLVAEAFLGKKPSKMEVCHKDGIRTNNSSTNLKYGTRKDNMEDAIKHGTTRAKAVLRSDGRWFRSIQEAATESGVSHATVINSINNKHKPRKFEFELA